MWSINYDAPNIIILGLDKYPHSSLPIGIVSSIEQWRPIGGLPLTKKRSKRGCHLNLLLFLKIGTPIDMRASALIPLVAQGDNPRGGAELGFD